MINHRQTPSDWCRIYCLRENGSNQIRYVGQTKLSISERFYFHIFLHRHTSDVCKWIDSLSSAPDVDCLDENGTWNFSEDLWIERFRRQGHPLLNKLTWNERFMKSVAFEAH